MDLRTLNSAGSPRTSTGTYRSCRTFVACVVKLVSNRSGRDFTPVLSA